MALRRLFLGLDLSPEAKLNIGNWREKNLHGLPDKPVPMENFHLTLSFLGAVESSKMSLLEQEVENLAGNCFNTHTTEIGCFQKAKVLYLGVAKTPELHQLAQQCRRINRVLGQPQHHSEFTPHVTIFRNHKAPYEISTEALNEQLHFSQVHLFESVSNVKFGKPPHYVKRLSVDLTPSYRNHKKL